MRPSEINGSGLAEAPPFIPSDLTGLSDASLASTAGPRRGNEGRHFIRESLSVGDGTVGDWSCTCGRTALDFGALQVYERSAVQ